MIVQPSGVRLTEAEHLVLSAAVGEWSLGQLMSWARCGGDESSVNAMRPTPDAVVGALVVVMTAGLVAVNRRGGVERRSSDDASVQPNRGVPASSPLRSEFEFWLRLTELGQELLRLPSVEVAS